MQHVCKQTDQEENETEDINKNVELPSPTRRRISDGIQSIMSRLNLGINSTANSNDINERFVSPWNIDDYCNHHSETALHAAVRQKNVEIVSLLLATGANANLSIYPLDAVSVLPFILECEKLTYNSDFFFTGL